VTGSGPQGKPFRDVRLISVAIRRGFQGTAATSSFPLCPAPPGGPYAVEKLLLPKFAKIKSRQDAPQTTFSVFLDIFYPPNSCCFEENGLFQYPRDLSPSILGIKPPTADFKLHHYLDTGFLDAEGSCQLPCRRAARGWGSIGSVRGILPTTQTLTSHRGALHDVASGSYLGSIAAQGTACPHNRPPVGHALEVRSSSLSICAKMNIACGHRRLEQHGRHMRWSQNQ
jgi:hypothetical protein